MPLSHAVVWISYHEADILEFSANELFDDSILREHVHYARQQGDEELSEQAFFGEVCGALSGIKSIWVAGNLMIQADFSRYINQHRPALSRQIVRWETANQPGPGQLIMMARKFFSDRGELP
jgi:hypothetical protein